jgi:hypothetical protein
MGWFGARNWPKVARGIGLHDARISRDRRQSLGTDLRWLSSHNFPRYNPPANPRCSHANPGGEVALIVAGVWRHMCREWLRVAEEKANEEVDKPNAAE